MPRKPKAPTTSQRKGFVKGDLVWLAGISTTSQRDNVYRVEGIEHRHMMTSYPDSSLLKLRLVLKVFYSWERVNEFQYYDECNCELLEVNHIEELQAKFGKIIKDIYDLHAGNKKKVEDANSNRPIKRASRRKAVEPKSDKRPSTRSRSKEAL
jgi:hypothetical protein